MRHFFSIGGILRTAETVSPCPAQEATIARSHRISSSSSEIGSGETWTVLKEGKDNDIVVYEGPWGNAAGCGRRR
jgi:hypothetical protein